MRRTGEDAGGMAPARRICSSRSGRSAVWNREPRAAAGASIGKVGGPQESPLRGTACRQRSERKTSEELQTRPRRSSPGEPDQRLDSFANFAGIRPARGRHDHSSRATWHSSRGKKLSSTVPAPDPATSCRPCEAMAYYPLDSIASRKRHIPEDGLSSGNSVPSPACLAVRARARRAASARRAHGLEMARRMSLSSALALASRSLGWFLGHSTSKRHHTSSISPCSSELRARASAAAFTREPLAKLLGLAAWRSPQFSW